MAWWNPATWRQPAAPAPPPEAKASAVGSLISAWTVGQPVWTERDYAELAREGYVLNAVGHFCTRLIASNAATAPWVLYGPDGTEIDDHPALDLLADPNPHVGSGAAFFRAIYAYLVLSGNSYIEEVGPLRRDAQPQELWPLRPDRMKVVPGPLGIPQAYAYEANGMERRFQADPRTGRAPVLHIRDFHPTDDWYGLSRIEVAAYAVDRHNAASAHNKALLDNGARPSGALIFKPVGGPSGEGDVSAPDEVLKAAERRLGDRHGGPDNAGRPLVLGGNVAWQEMGLTPRDMDFGEAKNDAARDICTAFGVPHLLVVRGEATYNNRATAKLELWEETILPLVEHVQAAFNEWLLPRFGDGLRFGVDLDAIPALEPRRETKRATTVMLLEKGVIDADEAREALGYGERDETTLLKVDAGVLTALVGAVETAGPEPLMRYMQSVGLFDPSMSVEDMLAAATDYLGEDDESAVTPPPPPPPDPNQLPPPPPAPDDGEDDDA